MLKLRCDNGTEYTNEKMKSYCRKKGIKLDYTVSHTPQQNGRAERLNRTLLDKARALIIDSGLKKEMWGEAIRVAAYFVNRSPTESLTVTPNQLWTGEKPDLSNCRVFGCKAYAKELGYLKKLDERSKQLIFIGYSLGGYRLWDASKRRVIIRRDVVFCKKKRESSEEEMVNLIEAEEEEEEEVAEEEIISNSEEEEEREADQKEEVEPEVEEIQDTSKEDEEQFHNVQMTDQSDYSETEEDSSDTSHSVTAQPERRRSRCGSTNTFC